MDPFSHGLVGASVSSFKKDSKKLRTAILVGFFAALLPDLDILIRSSDNPLLNVELHRHFSHSFLFSPAGALLATLISYWFAKKHLSLKQVFVISWIAYLSALLLDAATSYGTMLLWPFSDIRFSWNIISVFDPLFTVVLLMLMVLLFIKKKKIYSLLSVLWVLLYLSFGFYQQQRALGVVEYYVETKNYEVSKIIVKPTIANNFLWSARIIEEDEIHPIAIRILPFFNPVIYQGKSGKIIDWRKKYEKYKGTTLYEDLERFSSLSDGVLVEHPNYENFIGDGRYSMLPTSSVPIWGVHADTLNPNSHLDFKNYRDFSLRDRDEFLGMIQGEVLSTQ